MRTGGSTCKLWKEAALDVLMGDDAASRPRRCAKGPCEQCARPMYYSRLSHGCVPCAHSFCLCRRFLPPVDQQAQRSGTTCAATVSEPSAGEKGGITWPTLTQAAIQTEHVRSGCNHPAVTCQHACVVPTWQSHSTPNMQRSSCRSTHPPACST